MKQTTSDNLEETIMDVLDQARIERLAEINLEPSHRQALESAYGQVWDTAEFVAEFDVLGFLAPFVVVQRKSDRQKGSIEFQHDPRFYFRFVPDKL
jgi:hypothetical protein